MAMNRTIFEIPGYLENFTLGSLENYSLSYTSKPIAGTSHVEVAITYSKSQSYIIDLLESKINSMVDTRLQAAS
jgi:hypothetical protein